MRKVSDADKLFYFERTFFTLDGLWFLETEKEIGWEKVLAIDIEVWIKLLKIIFHRVKKYLKIETNTLKDLIDILTFRWSVEGWEYNIRKEENNTILIEIRRCPYKSIMERNPERQDKIPLICGKMCTPLYKAVIKEFNPKIKLEKSTFMGLRDKVCDFFFKSN